MIYITRHKKTAIEWLRFQPCDFKIDGLCPSALVLFTYFESVPEKGVGPIRFIGVRPGSSSGPPWKCLNQIHLHPQISHNETPLNSGSPNPLIIKFPTSGCLLTKHLLQLDPLVKGLKWITQCDPHMYRTQKLVTLCKAYTNTERCTGHPECRCCHAALLISFHVFIRCLGKNQLWRGVPCPVP